MLIMIIYDQNYTFPQRDIYTGRARWTAAMSNQNILAVTKVPQRPPHFSLIFYFKLLILSIKLSYYHEKFR